ATLGWALYQSIEFYEETVETPWSLEARRNPYLAAQQFLQRSGIEVTEADSLIHLNNLESVSTVFISHAGQIVNPRQLDAVISWLQEGGSLIITADSVATEDDLLLQAFEVDVDWTGYDYEDIDDEEEEQSMSESLREYNEKIDSGMTPEQISAEAGDESILTSIEFSDDIGTLDILFDPDLVLSHPYVAGDNDREGSDRNPFSWASSENGIHLMQFNVGEGLLTIVSDSSIWRSSHIDQFDHAYLLWILSATDGDFAILRTTERESLWDSFFHNAYELLIALSIFIAFWVWYTAQRFGRITPIEIGQRRALSEHFSTTANYLWHRNAAEYLLQPLRDQIFRRAHLAIPAFAASDIETRFTLVAEHSNIDRQAIVHGLQASDFNETSFVRTVKLLKQIEQSI
ncbi:MAG: DUF4350 domain-containing protein, partial [Gammaproteobacteria bacterium]|nr:DUF4350 domain-containing protein [Gammaproteobacteria bacterium]